MVSMEWGWILEFICAIGSIVLLRNPLQKKIKKMRNLVFFSCWIPGKIWKRVSFCLIYNDSCVFNTVSVVLQFIVPTGSLVLQGHPCCHIQYSNSILLGTLVKKTHNNNSVCEGMTNFSGKHTLDSRKTGLLYFAPLVLFNLLKEKLFSKQYFKAEENFREIFVGGTCLFLHSYEMLGIFLQGIYGLVYMCV